MSQSHMDTTYQWQLTALHIIYLRGSLALENETLFPYENCHWLKYQIYFFT